jgi:hypothetical protein
MVIRRRRRSGVPYVLPLAALALLLIAGAWSARVLPYEIAILAQPLDPSMKATLLAKGISELMNCAAFFVVVVVPLGVGGYFADRWLLARWKSRPSRPRHTQ